MNGVNTPLFEELSGLSAYNLGVRGFVQIDGAQLLLRDYLEHHPAPRLVVLCFDPHEVGERPTNATESKQLVLDAFTKTKANYLWCYYSQDGFPRPTHARPWRYYVMQGLLEVLGALAGGERRVLNQPTQLFGDTSFNDSRVEIARSRGYASPGTRHISAAARRSLDSYALPDGVGASQRDPYPVGQKFDAGLRAFVRFAQEQGILVLLRLTPVLPAAHEEHYDRLDEWFNRLEAECPGLVVDRPPVLIYDPRFVVDENNHLNHAGGERFTSELVGAVKAALADDHNPGPATSGPARPAE